MYVKSTLKNTPMKPETVDKITEVPNTKFSYFIIHSAAVTSCYINVNCGSFVSFVGVVSIITNELRFY